MQIGFFLLKFTFLRFIHLDICGSSPFIATIVQYFTAWVTLRVLVPWWGMAGFHLLAITGSAAWELLQRSCGHWQSLNVLVCGVCSGYTAEATLAYFLYGQNAFRSIKNCQITFQGICTFYISPSSVCECLLLQSLPTLGLVTLILAILISARVAHRMALICLSWWLLMLNIISGGYCSLMYLLWKAS